VISFNDLAASVNRNPWRNIHHDENHIWRQNRSNEGQLIY